MEEMRVRSRRIFSQRLAKTMMCGLGLMDVTIIVRWASDGLRPDFSLPPSVEFLMRSKPAVETLNVSHREDHELIQLIRNREAGFEDAASILTERLGGFLVSMICSVGKLQPDDLVEVTQQTWIRAFTQGPEEFASAAEFRSWLKQVARTKSLDLLRKRPHVSIPDAFETTQRVSPQSRHVQALELCMKELEAVKPEFAAVVRGVCAGKPGQQLSLELGISQNTVYSRFDRSKLILKDCIERRLA